MKLRDRKRIFSDEVFLIMEGDIFCKSNLRFYWKGDREKEKRGGRRIEKKGVRIYFII
jgi:hypothetical protein